MTEEKKNNDIQETTEEKKSQGEVVKTVFKYLLGIILVIVGIVFVWVWRKDLWTVIKGCLGLFLILAGAITIAIAKE